MKTIDQIKNVLSTVFLRDEFNDYRDKGTHIERLGIHTKKLPALQQEVGDGWEVIQRSENNGFSLVDIRPM